MKLMEEREEEKETIPRIQTGRPPLCEKETQAERSVTLRRRKRLPARTINKHEKRWHAVYLLRDGIVLVVKK